MVFDHGFMGLSLRFAVDNFIELTPILEKGFEFKGDCPFTDHPGGVVVNEFKETIRFEQLDVELSGHDLLRKLDQLFQSHDFEMCYSRPMNEENTGSGNQKILFRINGQLKSLEKRIQQITKKIVSGGYENCRDCFDFDAHVEIDYYIPETHRLYHPDSDNILCRQWFLVSGEIFGHSGEPHVHDLVYKSGDHTSPLEFDFEEAYLFHDLYDHQGCYLHDIVQISDIYYSIILENQFHQKILQDY